MTVPLNAVSSLSQSQAQDPRSDGVSTDLIALAAARENERFTLHSKYLNEMWVRVLKTIGYDVGFTRGVGPYLCDRAGDRYLDLLSGWGVFALGRNHPEVRDALISVLDGELRQSRAARRLRCSPACSPSGCSKCTPWLDKAFFANSGAEVDRGRDQIRARRDRPIRPSSHCAHSFHGLTYGALSMNGDAIFNRDSDLSLSDVREVPLDDHTSARGGAAQPSTSRRFSSS